MADEIVELKKCAGFEKLSSIGGVWMHGRFFLKNVAAGAEGFGVRWLAIALDFFAFANRKNQPRG